MSLELDVIRIVVYGFGSAIIMLFVYMSVLAGFFIKHIIEESKEESF
jgi:hypothetical protein